MTLDRALQLLSLPRRVGVDPDSGEEIVANFGRFGPYVKRGDEFRSLASDGDVFRVSLDEALELLRQEKPSRRGGASRTVLRELGQHPESGAAVRLLEGRYGPYVTDGTVNASLPKDAKPDELTLEGAVKMLADRAARGPARGRRSSGSRGDRGTRTRKAAARKPRA
jgi:DNA topoisomerase-1